MQKQENKLTSEELLDGARRQDQRACSALIQQHQRQVASTIYGILGICNEAEDIGQETFLRFFSTLERFRGESSVATYLTRIAVNLCINEIRKRQRHRLLHWDFTPEQMDNLHESGPTPQASLEQISVHRALQKLKPNYRTVVVLRHLCGYNTAETASILSLPLGTVLSRLARAQDQLRGILNPQGKEKEYENEKKLEPVA